MSFVGTEVFDGRGRDLHQEAIHQLLIAIKRRAQPRGDGHDGVKIVAGQQLGLTLLEPLLSLARMAFWAGAVPAAVVAPKRVIAIVAAVEQSPQLSSAAGRDVGT